MKLPDLDKFSKELTDTINGGLKSGVPLTFVSMALDMASFELKGKHIEMLKTMQNKQPFKPEIVIEDGKSN